VGVVDGHTVAIGGRRFVTTHLPQSAVWPWAGAVDHSAEVTVAIDEKPAGRIVMDAPLRAGAEETVQDLRSLGFTKIVLASGDEPSVTARAGAALAVDETHALLDRQQRPRSSPPSPDR
jgi:cation transport ATPase